jgi:hypothetical protein
MRRLLLIVAVGTLAALLPASALAWSSSSFRSPSGNIRCEYFGSGISCGTLNDGYTITLYRYGRTAVGIDNVYGFRGGPVLAYGLRWRSRFIICDSFFSGMQCENRQGHGFFLNRDEVRRW